MELVELVSPHVAMPVIGVVVCAIMVFAFGFRSPVQPPSFDFEEDENKRIKRRPKPSKVKSSTNGTVIQNEASSETTKSSPQGQKERKANSQSPRTKATEAKVVSKKDIKQESRPDKKLKKLAGKDTTTKADLTVPERKDVEDDGEWTTIQVSKKGKKQKVGNKKDESQAEAAVTPVNEADSSPAPHAAAAAAAAPVTPETEEPKSPQADKGKKKKKSKLEEKESTVSQSAETTAMESVSTGQQPEEPQIDLKKKKNKRDKKSSGATADADGAAASASENLPQDATPASGKASKKEASAATTLDVVENVQDASKQTPKKKKGKGKDVVEPPNVAEKVTAVKSSLPSKQESTVQTTKSEKSKPASKAAANDTAQPTKSNEALEAPKADAATANPAPTGISFDEIGDSWIEAAPKSKKKKSRREN